MTYEEVMKKAKSESGPYCKVCPQCNGKACKNQMPGPGAKGVGDVAIRNYDAWKDIRINMDTICENVTPDTSIELFGEKFDYPFFAGPDVYKRQDFCRNFSGNQIFKTSGGKWQSSNRRSKYGCTNP